MRVLTQSFFAASLIGGAVALSGANPASAAALAPAFAPSADVAAVQKVTHDPLARPGRYYGQWYSQPRTYSRYGYARNYRRSGPAIGFGLSVPGFSFGFGAPSRYYGYRQPWDFGWPGPYGNTVGYTGY